MVAKGKSLCKGKKVESPNLCKKVRGCKVAKGTKRVFCRKAHNKTKKVRHSRKTPVKKSLGRRKIFNTV
jgi:hypothetical protein